MNKESPKHKIIVIIKVQSASLICNENEEEFAYISIVGEMQHLIKCDFKIIKL